MPFLGLPWTGTGTEAPAWSDAIRAAVAWALSFTRDSAPPERMIGATALKRRISANPERGSAMQLTWPSKDPVEVLDYGIDWTPRDFGGDPLISCDAVVLSGDVTIAKPANVDPSGVTTTIWLQGGTSGVRSVVMVTGRTQSGRVAIERVRVLVK